MKLTDRVILFTAEGFGLGRIKPAPGTWGSLWGIPIGCALGYFDTTWWMRLLVGVAMFVVGVPICAKGAKLRNTKDPGSVVWDEMAAFPIVYAFVPLYGESGTRPFHPTPRWTDPSPHADPLPCGIWEPPPQT